MTKPEPPVGRDMSRWLGDGGMPLLGALGLSFEDYGIEDDDEAGFATATWVPTVLCCNPHGVVQAGVHAIVLDAAMNFALNAGLAKGASARATLEMKVETMRAAAGGAPLSVRAAVVREARQIAFVEGRTEDAECRLVSRATGTFLIARPQ